MKALLKKSLARGGVLAGIDRFGRWRNRHRLLTVMYHGVTRQEYDPPVWTQLPERIFRRQIAFLARYYRPVTLQQVLDAIAGDRPLPPRAVLVTFDDGLRNNATVAWPILQEFQVPAAIFLTVDFIGTDRFFWVDELYLYLVEGKRQGISLPLQRWPEASVLLARGDVWGAYLEVVETCKRMPQQERVDLLEQLRKAVSLNRAEWAEDFGLLDWQQVGEMAAEGLIDFGAHTATHQILTGMEPTQIEAELVTARQTLENRLQRPVTSFCYPNGRKGVDFNPDHETLLKRIGYRCAFATDRALFRPAVDNPMAIGRIPAGHDLTSDPAWFRLSAARG